MNKKLNTVLFIIVGTIINIIITLALMFGLLFFFAFALQNLPEVFNILSVVIIIGTMLGSMLIYQKLSLWVVEKFHLEDKLEPLWGNHKKKQY